MCVRFFFIFCEIARPDCSDYVHVHHNCIQCSSFRGSSTSRRRNSLPSFNDVALRVVVLEGKRYRNSRVCFRQYRRRAIDPPWSLDRKFLHRRRLMDDTIHHVVAVATWSINTNARDEAELSINNISSARIIPFSDPPGVSPAYERIVRVQTPSIISAMRLIESDGSKGIGIGETGSSKGYRRKKGVLPISPCGRSVALGSQHSAASHYDTDGNDVDSSAVDVVTNLLSRGLTLLRETCNDRYAHGVTIAWSSINGGK